MGKEKNNNCPNYIDKKWYAYNGSGNIYDAASYRSVTIPPICERGKQICAIYAKSGGVTPSISQNVIQYISNALVTGLAQPPIFGKRSKIFVYLKD